MNKYVKFFNEISKDDFQCVGGKAANLGELSRNGFNVPPGFCVTSDSLIYLIDQNMLQQKIDAIVDGFDYKDINGLEKKTNLVRDLIITAEIPQDLKQEIYESIEELNKPEPPFVAVRSSVSVKDSEISSFPGMMDTYHYLKGEKDIIEHIRMCWGSLWTSRATLTRYRKEIDHNAGLIAPTIQKMVHSEKAGVMFTANPITNSRDEIVIESNWGLGESVVSGKSMNDFYVVHKQPLELKDRRIAAKNIMFCFDHEKGYGRKEMEVPDVRKSVQTLSEKQVMELGDIGLKIEKVYEFPQDIEWAYENDELYILQSRNIRTLNV